MKKILSRDAVRRVDAATIASGVRSIDLMESAATAFVARFKKLHQGGAVSVVCGPGNNGGDGLAIARMLHQQGIHVNVFHLNGERRSQDFEINFERLGEAGLRSHEITAADALIDSNSTAIIDALFGTGLNKPLDGLEAYVVATINQLDAVRVSVDVPSGILETPAMNESFVNADHVIAFQVPRVDLLLPRVGYNPYSIHVVDIGLNEAAIESEQTSFYWVEEKDVNQLIMRRRVFDHKYSFGHALIVAGARQTLGAALLATGAALRSGCGLVTTHTISAGGVALNARYPEAMFSNDAHNDHITGIAIREKINAVGIGCGIGKENETASAVIEVFTKTKLPCVIDADALNILSEQHAWKDLVPVGSVLTPHQKEFDRLTGEHDSDWLRMQRQIELAIELKSTVVVKGAYTRIALPNGTCLFNSSGTVALATAGSGDVLTGLITGLIARGYEPADAAIAGVYIHGCAARLAEEKLGIECVCASDVIDCLPETIKQLST